MIDIHWLMGVQFLPDGSIQVFIEVCELIRLLPEIDLIPGKKQAYPGIEKQAFQYTGINVPDYTKGCFARCSG